MLLSHEFFIARNLKSLFSSGFILCLDVGAWLINKNQHIQNLDFHKYVTK